MMSTDYDALYCDLAETYHIYGTTSLAIEDIARLACGLQEESRIMQKMNNIKFKPKSLILSHISDNLALLRCGKEAQFLFLENLEQGQCETEETKKGFNTPEEYEKAWKEIAGREE